jgi:hypothetical protein
MPRLVRVDVTREDTRHRTMSATADCMCARAISRALGYPVNVGMWAVWRAGTAHTIATLPKSIENKISAWCNKEYIDPFSFDLEVSDDPEVLAEDHDADVAC